jgi:hydroxyacylglutathione hydrolase
MINIEPIKAFDDNYIWLMTTNEGSIVIDPGESINLLKTIEQNDIKLVAILITHHHYDHTGGIEELLIKYPNLKVYGPINNIDSIKSRLMDGEKLNIIGVDFEVIEIPGHTLDHIAYYANINSSPILFCGDTLFAGGCGRVFEGTFDQMYESLMKLKKLPKNTRIYCGHEYTINNLKFAKAVEPDNIDLITRYNEVLELRKNNIPTLPSTISIELKTNPFFRAGENNVQKIISNKFKTGLNEKEIFSALRQWKDNY